MNLATPEGQTRAAALLTHFRRHGVRQSDKPLDFVLEWQDLLGHSSYPAITGYWNSLPERSDSGVDRDTFLFVNLNTLSSDEVLNIFVRTVGASIASKLQQDVDARNKETEDKLAKERSELEQEERKLNESRAHVLDLQFEVHGRQYKLAREMAELENQINSLKTANEGLQQQVIELQSDNDRLRTAAQNYTQLQQILRDLLSQTYEVKSITVV